MYRQYTTTSRQDAIITIRLYLAKCFGRDRPSSGQLRTILRYNKNGWPEDCRSGPKHVAKYDLIVIIASCLDVCCVLTVHNILHKFDNTQRDGLSQIFEELLASQKGLCPFELIKP